MKRRIFRLLCIRKCTFVRTGCKITVTKTIALVLAVALTSLLIADFFGVNVHADVEEFGQVRDASQRTSTHPNLTNRTITSTKLNLTDRTIQKWDVQVISYMRSGSSFLGLLLGDRSDSFYWYEPFWKTNAWTYFRDDGSLCNYYNSHCTKRQSFASKHTQFLEDIYNCELSGYSQNVDARIHPSKTYAGA